MPTSTLFGTAITSGRSFDFSNIASEAVRAVEVYKTSMSNIPTGGIGATINIATARPLEIGERANELWSERCLGYIRAGWKYRDTPSFPASTATCSPTVPSALPCRPVYQKRNFGYNQASTSSGWIPDAYLADWQSLPAPGSEAAGNFENLPAEGELYSLPQNLLYNQIDAERKRFNGGRW